MRHVTVNFIRFAGAGEGEAALRRATCLVENARHLRRDGRGDGAWLDIVLLGDIEALSPAVRAELERPPCRVHDGRAEYEALVRRHPRLMQRFAGPYGVIAFAFLRWTLIARMFPGEPVLCYDGDVLHNVALRDLERAFAGLTTTATSTCFAAISDPSWFSAWEQAVLALEDDPGRFDRVMRRALSGIGAVPQLSAEEFLAKVLIEDGTLRQDPLPADFPYWIVPNPQTLPRLYWYVRPRGSPARIPAPMRYERRGGIDHISDRPVAFWHMQKPFLNQLGILTTQQDDLAAGLPARVPVLSFYGRFPYGALIRAIDPYHEEFPMPMPPQRLRPLARAMIAAEQWHWENSATIEHNPFSPAAIYRRYFEEGDLGMLFNDRTWPEPGIWT